MTYTYRCTQCKKEFEVEHSMTDDSLHRCPECRGVALKIVTSAAPVFFKGSGFYITDKDKK